MSSERSRVRKIFRELRRRKVFRVTAVYVVLAAGALELLDVLIPATELPEWATPLLVSLAVVGLPVVIVLSWTFDITPEGVVRTGKVDPPAAARERAPEGEAPAVPEEAPAITAVAILPFQNLSGSDEAEPFAVGLHDDLLTELSRASALTVISRTSVQGYRGTDKSVKEIAQELGVGTIVEGGVQKAGDRVRLNIQVIDARTDTHRWAERYDRELTTDTIFELQSELATRIMGALKADLTPEERARTHGAPTDDLEAYRLNSLGREAFVDRSEEGLKRAADYFQQAIERDPDYAPAWAGLGMALAALVDYGHVHGEDEDLLERGMAALRKALELDPELAEAHAAVGATMAISRDGPGALAALARAREYGPGVSLGFQWASWVELLVGDAHGALASASRATQLAPLDPEARGNLAMAFLATKDPERAVLEAERSLESHPDFAYSRWALGLALFHVGRRDEALAELEALGGEDHEPWPAFRPWAALAPGLRHVAAGEEEAARRIRAELGRMDAPFEEGILSAALGDVDAAFEGFRRAAPFFWDDALALRYFRADPIAPLRSDSRFRDLLGELDRGWGI